VLLSEKQQLKIWIVAKRKTTLKKKTHWLLEEKQHF